MAQKKTICPNCNSDKVSVKEIYNPDTTDMNCNASIHCNECGHIWDDLVTSPHMKKLREKGRRR